MGTTFDDILVFAIEKEKEAVELYKKMSKLAKKPNVKAMFDEFVDEELTHVKVLEELDLDSLEGSPSGKVTDLKISDYLIDMEFKEDMVYQDALIFAMKREENAVKLYKYMLANAKDPKLIRLLEFMVNEEAKHKLRLETEYDDNVLVES
jgi:rubrerythrin